MTLTERQQWHREALEALARSQLVLAEVRETQCRVDETLRRSYVIDEALKAMRWRR